MQYSDKVIQHFQQPHNVGEIKDADAIGKVGNPVCLLPNMKVHANDHLKEIKTLNNRQNVLSHDGRYNKIKRIMNRNYSGELIYIKNRFGELYITPEHEILAIKLPKTHHFLYLKNKKKKTKEWLHAQELEKGDILLYPILKEIEDLDEIQINIKKHKYDFKSKNLPKSVKINSGFLRLAGYYLSEGSIRDRECNTHLCFTFNSNEKKYINDVIKIVKDLFGLTVKIDLRKKSHSLNILVYSARLARFFKKLFNKGVENKRIPHFILLLPPKKQEELIKGMWRGDGFTNLKKPRAGFTTISYELAHQMKTLLLRQKIIPSIYIEEGYIKEEVNHKRAYRIHVGNRDSVLRLFNILGIDYTTNKESRYDVWIDEDYAYIPITSFQRKKYNGSVYNLEVNNAMSYVTESATVHNCGDLMWIYIKVKKNEKGEEILEDVHFKTFGCVAAIATSSMITDLAKGKTLDDALKITKRDVSAALGSLPPIKEHCSNLAAEGLHKAIENYRKKVPVNTEKGFKKCEKSCCPGGKK